MFVVGCLGGAGTGAEIEVNFGSGFRFCVEQHLVELRKVGLEEPVQLVTFDIFIFQHVALWVSVLALFARGEQTVSVRWISRRGRGMEMVVQLGSWSSSKGS